ncbi:hypothetical protein ACODM8_15900 [Vibrio ostreicida]|uniref:hypothetical protein n=1 Tax=Vibrio ostreicida TaxID=526588 RepID=UPI003B5900AE
MTNKANTLADEPTESPSNESDSLPEVKKKTSNKTMNSKWLFGVSMLLGSLLIYGWYVWLPKYEAEKQFENVTIQTNSDANEEEEVPYTPEAVPTVPTADNDEELPEPSDVSESPYLETQLTSTFERQTEAINSLSDGVAQGFQQLTNTVVNSLNTQRDANTVIVDNQKELFDVVSQLNKNVQDLNRTLKGVNRNTSKVLDEIKDMKMLIVNTSQAFPVVVYSKGRWGDQEYVTIAPKDYPTQTKNLRLNESAGDWTLVEILGHEVVFKHYNGRTKRVSL